ncbi:hypothetical protein C2S51_002844 [Perilla frutescens var. frutescens]|nr:hypothetical protein C2S51_002844 [Perilla frutescens var. frutescens]
MADTLMSESADVCALKEALCAQQQLLQKLYNELDAEREASATATNEALAVILRLQGEKAAVKMEAEQYKRLSEQKICHAEESLAIIEDVIYQKEMEVAALDYQVQAYRYKLLSMGCVDSGLGGTRFPDNLLQRNESLAGETSIGSIGRRHSAPMSCKFKNAVSERDGCRMQERNLVSSIVEERLGEEMCGKASDSEKKIDSSSPGGNEISTYWEQIRKLDERVKEIAGANYMSSRSETRSPSSLSSRVSRGSSCELSSSARNESSSCQPNKLGLMEGKGTDQNQTKSSDGVAADNSCSMSIHDVFEVPQVDCELLEKDEIKAACGGSKNLEKEDVVHPEAIKMCARDEPEWLKKVLQSTSFERKLWQPSDIDCRLVVVPPTTSISQFYPTMNQVNGASEIVEAERSAESSRREEELELLNEIKEKLDSVHDEIRSLKVKKSSSSTREEPSLSVALLSEAMLHFWI